MCLNAVKTHVLVLVSDHDDTFTLDVLLCGVSSLVLHSVKARSCMWHIVAYSGRLQHVAYSVVWRCAMPHSNAIHCIQLE